MGFKDTLKKIDIFGEAKKLTIQGEETHKTYMGAVCAISFILVLIASTMYYGMQYLTRLQNPTIVEQELYNDPSPDLDFTELNFILSITGKIDGNVVKPGELMRTVDIKFAEGSRFTNTTENSVKEKQEIETPIACTQENFEINGDNVIAEPQFSDLTLSVCKDTKNGTKPIVLSGGTEQDTAKKFFVVEIGPCTRDCRPDAASLISEKGLEITVGYAHASVDGTNYEKPIQFIFQSTIKFDCYQSLSYRRKYYMRLIQVETTHGLLDDQSTTKRAAEFDSEFVEDRKREPLDPYISLEFYSGHHSSLYSRTYIKLADVLGTIGGVSTAITTVIAILYGAYNSMSLKIHLINNTILYKETNINMKLRTKELPKFFATKLSMTIGCCQGCFSAQTILKTTLFFSGNVRIYQYLDINRIVENIRDIRVFKKIFLNEIQEKMIYKLERDSLRIDGDVDYFNLEVNTDSEDDDDEEEEEEEELKINKSKVSQEEATDPSKSNSEGVVKELQQRESFLTNSKTNKSGLDKKKKKKESALEKKDTFLSKLTRKSTMNLNDRKNQFFLEFFKFLIKSSISDFLNF